MTHYLGCLGLIKPEVDLIRTILRTSSRLDGRWALVEGGECDALLVYNIDKYFTPFVLKPSTQFIMIKRRGEPFSGRVFYKPFRADELVDTLLDIQSSKQSQSNHPHLTQSRPKSELSPTEDGQSEVRFYKLKKWPPADILTQHKNYMLLAVYLSRSVKTQQDLVTLSGQTEMLCSKFLAILQEHKLLHIYDSKHRELSEAHLVSNPQAEERKGFFSMLKTRLGLDNK